MSKLQYHDVETAILALQSAGSRVTNDAILHKIGHGSKSTIHRHFKTWQQAQPRATREERKIPESIQRAIAAEIEEVEAKAIAALKAELAEAQRTADELAATGESAEDKIAELEALLVAEKNMVTKISSVLTERNNQISRLETELRTQAGMTEQLRVQLVKAELMLEGFVELKASHRELTERLRSAELEAAELRGASRSGNHH